MTCQIMLFIMYIGEVRIVVKYIESNKILFAALGRTPVHRIHRRKAVGDIF